MKRRVIHAAYGEVLPPVTVTLRTTHFKHDRFRWTSAGETKVVANIVQQANCALSPLRVPMLLAGSTECRMAHLLKAHRAFARKVMPKKVLGR